MPSLQISATGGLSMMQSQLSSLPLPGISTGPHIWQSASSATPLQLLSSPSPQISTHLHCFSPST
jgi:hypothetical protein